MSEFFIVVSQDYDQHDTLEEAMTQQRMLQAHVPDKQHRILRCKTWLQSAKHFTKAVELLRDIRRDGLTDANRDRVIILLGTISTRSPKLETLTRVDGPPQFQGLADKCQPAQRPHGARRLPP